MVGKIARAVSMGASTPSSPGPSFADRLVRECVLVAQESHKWTEGRESSCGDGLAAEAAAAAAAVAGGAAADSVPHSPSIAQYPCSRTPQSISSDHLLEACTSLGLFRDPASAKHPVASGEVGEGDAPVPTRTHSSEAPSPARTHPILTTSPLEEFGESGCDEEDDQAGPGKAPGSGGPGPAQDGPPGHAPAAIEEPSSTTSHQPSSGEVRLEDEFGPGFPGYSGPVLTWPPRSPPASLGGSGTAGAVGPGLAAALAATGAGPNVAGPGWPESGGGDEPLPWWDPRARSSPVRGPRHYLSRTKPHEEEWAPKEMGQREASPSPEAEGPQVEGLSEYDPDDSQVFDLCLNLVLPFFERYFTTFNPCLAHVGTCDSLLVDLGFTLAAGGGGPWFAYTYTWLCLSRP